MTRDISSAVRIPDDIRSILEFAETLGIDSMKEPYLLWVAEEAVRQPVPNPWVELEQDGNTYYHNLVTGETTWNNPTDHVYRELVDNIHRNPDWNKRLTPASGVIPSSLEYNCWQLPSPILDVISTAISFGIDPHATPWLLWICYMQQIVPLPVDWREDALSTSGYPIYVHRKTGETLTYNPLENALRKIAEEHRHADPDPKRQWLVIPDPRPPSVTAFTEHDGSDRLLWYNFVTDEVCASPDDMPEEDEIITVPLVFIQSNTDKAIQQAVQTYQKFMPTANATGPIELTTLTPNPPGALSVKGGGSRLKHGSIPIPIRGRAGSIYSTLSDVTDRSESPGPTTSIRRESSDLGRRLLPHAPRLMTFMVKYRDKDGSKEHDLRVRYVASRTPGQAGHMALILDGKEVHGATIDADDGRPSEEWDLHLGRRLMLGGQTISLQMCCAQSRRWLEVSTGLLRDKIRKVEAVVLQFKRVQPLAIPRDARQTCLRGVLERLLDYREMLKIARPEMDFDDI